MLTAEHASKIVDYIEAVENCKGNHNLVIEYLDEIGLTEAEVDEALRVLGKIAGRDCGIL